MDSKFALLAVSDEYHVCRLRGHRDLLSLSPNLPNMWKQVVFIMSKDQQAIGSYINSYYAYVVSLRLVEE